MIRLPRACRGRTGVWFPANSSPMCWHLKDSPRQERVVLYMGLPHSLTGGYAMLMTPSKGETAVHGSHCLRDMAVHMHEVMARPWVGVCLPLALIYW